MSDGMENVVDKRWLRAAFERAATRYDEVAVLQREVADRLLERLDLVKLAPERVVDVGAGTGHCSNALSQRYKHSQVIALDIAPAMLRQARGRLSAWTRWRGRQRFVCGDAEALPLADGTCDLLFSNLTLQWCNDLDGVFREFRRVLKPGGLLMFSTFGPDTLKELRESWQAADDGYRHVNTFIDMHDIGDALVRAQLSTPVMDMEYFTLTYPQVQGLMHDLKAMGAHNVNRSRAHGLTGKGRLQAMQRAYERHRDADGLLPATYEVAYGHAWAPEQGLQQERRGEETRITLAQVRAGIHRQK